MNSHFYHNPYPDVESDQLSDFLRALSGDNFRSLDPQEINKLLVGLDVAINKYSEGRGKSLSELNVVSKGVDIIEALNSYYEEQRIVYDYDKHRISVCQQILASLTRILSNLGVYEHIIDKAKFNHNLIKALKLSGSTPPGKPSLDTNRFGEREQIDRDETIAFVTQNMERVISEVFLIGNTGEWPPDDYQTPTIQLGERLRNLRKRFQANQ